MNIRSFFSPSTNIPPEYRANFNFLNIDIAFYGVLSGASVTFLVYYATHIGATSLQIGWINAAPAIMSILFSLPFGAWMGGMSRRRAAQITSVVMRLFYLPLIFIPLIFPVEVQIPLIVALVFLTFIPGTGLVVSFNTLFAEAVPIDWRGYVSGVRNIYFAIASILTSVACGFILDLVSFPMGYVIVFGLGFLGAVGSTVGIWFIKPLDVPVPYVKTEPLQPGGWGDIPESFYKPSLQARISKNLRKLHPEALHGPFGKVLFLMFIFSVAQYLAIPVFPIYIVNVVGINDQFIGLGNAIFFVALFFASTQLSRLINKIGNQGVTGLGLLIMGGYPLFLALAKGNGMFLLASVFGGFGWAMASGAMANYVLEKAEPEARSSYVGWYNVIANAGILAGSLLGPVIADGIGLQSSLFLFTFVRVLVGLVLLRWV